MIARYKPSQPAAEPASKPAAKPGAAMLFRMKEEQLLVADETWPGMLRVKLKDGSLSGRYDLNRARDLARVLMRNASAEAG